MKTIEFPAMDLVKEFLPYVTQELERELEFEPLPGRKLIHKGWAKFDAQHPAEFIKSAHLFGLLDDLPPSFVLTRESSRHYWVVDNQCGDVYSIWERPETPEEGTACERCQYDPCACDERKHDPERG